MRLRQACVPLATLIIIATPAFAADDWPNWRGPNHDGISRETGLKTQWTTPLKLVWERPLGAAFSSFACVDDKVYTCGTADGQQVLYCLNADTGDVVWQHPFEKAYRERLGGDGSRATPSVSDGRVYIFGALGGLVCVDANDGREIWSKQYGKVPQWGYSGSVLIEGDLAIVSPGASHGGLVALDKKTGKQVWKSGSDIAGYATPYPFTFNDKRYIVGFMGKSAMIAEAESGKLVWRLPWKTDWNVNASSPIFHDGYLFLSSGYKHGCILLRLTADGEKLSAKKIWGDRTFRQKFQSCVLYEGHLYSSDERSLKCVDFETGDLKWEVPKLKHGTVLIADGHLFVLTEKGKLLIGSATPRSFEPLTEAGILGGRCWTIPVLYKGRIYARNLGRVVCFSLVD